MAPRTHPTIDVKTAAQPFPLAATDTTGVDVVAVHVAHGDFVWASLQRLGARDADLEDRFQEVFLVVHQRGAEFEGRSRVTTWLFGICLRVMAAHPSRSSPRIHALYDSGTVDTPASTPAGERRRTMSTRSSV